MAAAVQFGQTLREARQLRGLTIEQLSTETTIPVGHIEALEAGLIDSLPAAMYRRAEVRAYADAVGLDPAVILAQLERSGREAPPESPRPVPYIQDTRRAPDQNAMTDVRRAGKAVIMIVIGCGALLWEQAGAPSMDLTIAPAVTVPTIDPASLLDEAVRMAEPPRPVPTLRRALYEPGIAANGARWPRDGRLDEGVLVVHSTPRGARVTVNGVGWGVTPVAIRYLPLGTLRVRVGKTDHAMQDRLVELTAQNPTTVLRVTLPQLARRRTAPAATARGDTLVITSVPPGARVTVNGIGWGTTPVSIAHLPDGAQRVRVVKEQFKSEERIVTVGEGQPGRVAITLKPIS
jgi:transcriptional regulator with XRE-family HTH domain